MKKRGIYFYSPSDFAKDHLFSIRISIGEYTCVPPYHIKRKGLELFLPSVFFPESCILNIKGKILRLKKAILFFWIAEKSIIIM